MGMVLKDSTGFLSSFHRNGLTPNVPIYLENSVSESGTFEAKLFKALINLSLG